MDNHLTYNYDVKLYNVFGRFESISDDRSSSNGDMIILSF